MTASVTAALASIQIKGLLGDCLATQVGWAHRHPGQQLSVVVPDSGPYEYLRHVWEMSSLSAEVIPLPDAQVSTPALERESRIRAVDLLRSRGHETLVTLPSEDFGLGDPEEFYAPWFKAIVPSADSFFDHYAAPQAIQLRVPDGAKQWALAFLASHDIRDFVIVHNREAIGGVRMREAGSRHSDPFWNDMRNYRLEPLVDAALRVLPEETHVIRIGSAGHAIEPRRRFLDTIPMAIDLCQQMALLSRCRAYLGGPSGPVTFAWILRKPMLILNNPLLGGFMTQRGVPMVGLEKQILVDGRAREPTDVCMLEGGGAPGRLSHDCGYGLEENSQADIEASVAQLQRLITGGLAEHLVLSNGSFSTLAGLTSRYTGFSFVDRQTGFPQVFMAFERAIHDLMTSLMRHVFSRFAPGRPARLGLFGAAITGRQLLADFRRVVSWEMHFFDSDPAKQGTMLDGVPVHSPAELSRESTDLVIITSRSGLTDLSGRLRAEGWMRGENLFHHDDAASERRTFYLYPDLCGRVRTAAERYLGERLIPVAPC